MALESSLNELFNDSLTVQIVSAEPPLASFWFVLIFYGESLGGRGFVATNTLLSDTRTLISHCKITPWKNY